MGSSSSKRKCVIAKDRIRLSSLFDLLGGRSGSKQFIAACSRQDGRWVEPGNEETWEVGAQEGGASRKKLVHIG